MVFWFFHDLNPYHAKRGLEPGQIGSGRIGVFLESGFVLSNDLSFGSLAPVIFASVGRKSCTDITGAKLPKDRPYDGFDQTDFLLGKQENSNRDHLITFAGDRIIAVRWKQFRIYPLEFIPSGTNPEFTSGYLSATKETAGFPRVYNIDADPGELQDIVVSGYNWVLAKYGQIIAEYKATLQEHPNPPAPNLTRF